MAPSGRLLLPERRQHLRIVTLKNAAWLLAAAIAVFAAFSIWNELRPSDPSRERLYQRGTAATKPSAAPIPPETIEEEQPIAERTVRGGANRLALPPPPPPPDAAVATPERPRRLTFKEARERGERVVVTGGAEGVRTDVTPAPPTTTEPVVPPDGRPVTLSREDDEGSQNAKVSQLEILRFAQDDGVGVSSPG